MKKHSITVKPYKNWLLLILLIFLFLAFFIFFIMLILLIFFGGFYILTFSLIIFVIFLYLIYKQLKWIFFSSIEIEFKQNEIVVNSKIKTNNNYKYYYKEDIDDIFISNSELITQLKKIPLVGEFYYNYFLLTKRNNKSIKLIYRKKEIEILKNLTSEKADYLLGKFMEYYEFKK